MTEYQKLSILGGIHLYSNFPYYRTVRDLFLNQKIRLISAEYLNYKKNYDWVNIVEDIKLTDTWCSYEGCGDVKIHVEGKDDLRIEVTVYDGESFNGHRKNKRFRALFMADQLDVIKVFGESIDSRFRNHAEDVYSDRMELEKQKAIDAIEHELLANPK